MANIKRLLAEMDSSLRGEERNINQIFLTASHTITERYKAGSYIERLKAIIKKFNNLLSMHEKFQKTTSPQIGKTKEYTKHINRIAMEFHYLIATNQAMNDNFKEINKTGELQNEISQEVYR